MYRRSALILAGTLLTLISSAQPAGLAGARTRDAMPARIARTAAVTSPSIGQIPDLLRRTWQSYRHDFIQGDGRVIDHTRNQVSTSEGESYALLRAVWMNDRPTFDTVWTWTRNNLQVRHDALFGYLWGKHSNGRWSILSTNTATDADEDIALALVFAAQRWHDRAYLQAALPILRDIWRLEAVTIRGKPYLTAGNWAPGQATPGPAINPSYLAPYAYHIFARLDHTHPWSALVDTSYAVLQACSTAPLQERLSVQLPPDWCAIDRSTGRVTAFTGIKQPDAYGYDAFRSMWRVALDDRWYHEPRASAYLMHSAAFLRRQWQQHGALSAVYNHDGSVLNGRDDPTVYAGTVANFLVSDAADARIIAQKKLLATFTQQGGAAYWDQRYGYYEQNWVWFALALLDNQLPNIAAS